MKKRKITIFIIVVVAIVLTAIHFVYNRSDLVVEGRIIGAKSDMIYLERFSTSKGDILDSVRLSKDGSFSFRVKKSPEEPTFYELKCNWERIPILASRGESITVETIGNFSLNYTIDGSEESELLRTFYQPYMKGAAELRKITSRYAAKRGDGRDLGEISKVYNKKYQEIKQEQLKFIIANKGMMASLYALMQHLPGDEYLVDEMSDLIYKRTVAEELEAHYPNSAYVRMLNRSIEERVNLLKLMSNIKSLGYPDIEMNDVFGRKVSLSSFAGSVILVDFWAADLTQSNQNNLALKELFKRYHDDGFEIYQIGINDSRTKWIDAIQLQKLPWISVSDLRGNGSAALRIYNVTKLPSNILISKGGDIVARDLFGEELEMLIQREVKVQLEEK